MNERMIGWLMNETVTYNKHIPQKSRKINEINDIHNPEDIYQMGKGFKIPKAE